MMSKKKLVKKDKVKENSFEPKFNQKILFKNNLFGLVNISSDGKFAAYRYREKEVSCGLDGKPKQKDKKEIIVRIKDRKIENANLKKDWDNPRKLFK